MNNFLEKVEKVFYEWKETDKCSDATALNNMVKEQYFSECYPNFFFGNLNADLVLIQNGTKN
jgi:hypothetical protein